MPGLDFRPYLVRDVAYGFRRDGTAVVFLDETDDVPGTLALCVKTGNLIRQAFRKYCLAFLDHFGFKGTVSVSRGFGFNGAVLASWSF